MLITRTRTGIGTTVRVTDTPLIREDEVHRHPVCVPSDVDDDDYVSICEKGSTPPSLRFYDRNIPNRCSEVPNDSFVDTPDLILDLEMEEYYYSYTKKCHTCSHYNQPFVLMEEMPGPHGGYFPLDCDYETAARKDRELHKILAPYSFGKRYSKSEWAKLQEKLDWHKIPDDLKPLGGCDEHCISRVERVMAVGEDGKPIYIRGDEEEFSWEKNCVVHPYFYPAYDIVSYDIAGEELSRKRVVSHDPSERKRIKVGKRSVGNL